MKDVHQQVKTISVLTSSDEALIRDFFLGSRHLLDEPIAVLSGWTPVVYCIQNSKPDLLRVLLEVGADVNRSCVLSGVPDGQLGFRPLHFAIANESQACWDILLEYGADVNLTSGRGVSPLMAVASIAYSSDFSINAFNDLLSRGADIHHRDDAGNSVSHYVAVSASQLAFERLQERGADVLDQLSLGRDCYEAIQTAVRATSEAERRQLQVRAILSGLQQKKIELSMSALDGCDGCYAPAPSRSMKLGL